MSRCLPQQALTLLWLLLLIKETVFLLSEYRQASERQERAHTCTCPIVDCLEPEIVDQQWDFPFLYGLGTGAPVALALASTLRYLCSSHPSHREDVGSFLRENSGACRKCTLPRKQHEVSGIVHPQQSEKKNASANKFPLNDAPFLRNSREPLSPQTCCV